MIIEMSAYLSHVLLLCFLCQMDPYNVYSLKMSFLPVLIGLILGLTIGLLNHFSNLCMKVVDLLNSLCNPPTKHSCIRDWNKVQWSSRVASTTHLQRRMIGSFSWCSVEGEFYRTKQLNGPFGTLLDQNLKQGAQGSISHLGLPMSLGVTNGTIHEFSTQLLP